MGTGSFPYRELIEWWSDETDQLVIAYGAAWYELRFHRFFRDEGEREYVDQ